jgi:hypothetical protein
MWFGRHHEKLINKRIKEENASKRPPVILLSYLSKFPSACGVEFHYLVRIIGVHKGLH